MTAGTGRSGKDSVQAFGRFLSAMVMPNIGAFIAWGLITALFIKTGWLPTPLLGGFEDAAGKPHTGLVGPMITYLLPLLIAYTGGKVVADHRIVPPFTGENPLDVGVESFFEWIVEEPAFKGPIPKIEGMRLTDNLVAYVQRKLFTLNCGHAITAYLGNRQGHQTVEASINDPAIQEQVLAAMRQSGAALVKQYGFDEADHEKYIQKIAKRFQNPQIRDEVLRVGREPLRKLGARDRIIGPAQMAADLGLPNDALLRGAAAALHYDNPEDTQSVQVQALIRDRGLDAAVTETTGLQAGSPMHTQITEAYRKMASGG